MYPTGAALAWALVEVVLSPTAQLGKNTGR
jgi:hypothetical protein